MTDMSKLSDEFLLEAARQCSENESRKQQVMSELITRYVNIIVIKANKMANRFGMLNRQDTEDFISEGFLAFLNAIRTHDEKKGKFNTYANACIDNRMKNALGKAKRTFILSEQFDPEKVKEQSPAADEVVIEKEAHREILKKAKKHLSDREFKVFEMYLDAFSYLQISARLNISVKSVDNALSRARAKLKSVQK